MTIAQKLSRAANYYNVAREKLDPNDINRSWSGGEGGILAAGEDACLAHSAAANLYNNDLCIGLILPQVTYAFTN